MRQHATLRCVLQHKPRIVECNVGALDGDEAEPAVIFPICGFDFGDRPPAAKVPAKMSAGGVHRVELAPNDVMDVSRQECVDVVVRKQRWDV